MSDNKRSVWSWLNLATAGIRFGPDREEVYRELREHIEDKTADFQRIFPDMTEDEARDRAVAGMGDPVEVGKELAQIHRPWLGYLWVASRWLAALALAAAVLFCAPRLWDNVRYWWSRGREPSVMSYYLKGEDPFGPDTPHTPKTGEEPGVTRVPLSVFRPEETAKAGGYTLRVDRAALWSFYTDEELAALWSVEAGEEWGLFCQLRAVGWPWQPMNVKAAWRIRGVDSMGNRYYSSHEVYDQNVDRGEAGSVMVNPWSDGGRLGESFLVDVSGIPPGAEWLRLEYDDGGTVWSLTIPLEVEEGDYGG